MERAQVDQVAATMRLAAAPFTVAVVVEEAPEYGGWAVGVRPPSGDKASVEVLIPDGAADECLINAGSGSAHQYTGGDVPWIVTDMLPIIRAAAYGDPQTAGDTLYLHGDRGWSTRGGISLLPRILRRRSRYEAYPPAEPPPLLRDLVGLVAEQLTARFAVESEELSDDGG